MKMYSEKITVDRLVKEFNKNVYDLNHPLQRQEGQWGKQQKSYLIDSMLRNYPLDPIRIVEGLCDEEGNRINSRPFVIDGKQRATTIIEYFHNEFSISKSIENRPFDIYDQRYYPAKELCAKKFFSLENDIKDYLCSYNILIYYFNQATEKDVREMFTRQNSGTVLTKNQKSTSKLSFDLISRIRNLYSHPVWSITSLTHTNVIKDEIRAIILSTFMLMNEETTINLTSTYLFNVYYKNIEKWDEDKIDYLFSEFNYCIDNIYNLVINRFGNLRFITKAIFPHIVYYYYKLSILHKENVFNAWMQEFINNKYIMSDEREIWVSVSFKPEYSTKRHSYFKHLIDQES